MPELTVSAQRLLTLMRGYRELGGAPPDLCMSVRTLQRGLSAEGTTFKVVLEKTRAELAKSYLLESPFSNAQVSVLLGYSESSQFYQAFRRWFSCSPGEFRLCYHSRSSNQPGTDP